MRNLQKNLALLLSMLCLLPCGQAMAARATLDVAMVCDESLRMHPLEVAERSPQSLMNLVYESVITIDDDRRPQGGLAASWTQMNGGTTWTFTLHDDVYFHDGRKLTAYDVIATLNKISSLANEGKGLYQQTVSLLTSWEANSELTFTVRSKQGTYMVLYVMNFPVLPSSAVDQECPPGTGPYRIDYYQPGSMLLLIANENWWKRTPLLHTITAHWYKNDTAALGAFQAEEVDVLMTRSLTATRYRGIIGSTINSYDYSTNQLECLLFNNYASIFRSAEFRQALSFAIDTSRLATAVYQSIATATDTLAMPGSYLNNSSLRSYKYDVDTANRMLDDLGYNKYDSNGYRYKESSDGKITSLELRLCYYDEPGSSLRKEVAGMIVTMLAQVGINVRTTLYSFENAQGKLNSGDFDLFLCAYNFGVIPDLNYVFGDGNYARYNSTEMSALLKKLNNAHEEATFQAAWMDIQALFHEDQPFLPLYWRGGLLLMRDVYVSTRDIREYELLRGLESYGY